MFCTAVATSLPRRATSSTSSSLKASGRSRERLTHPDRARAEQERRHELAAEAEREELVVLRELTLGQVASHDEPPVEHASQHRALDRTDAAGWENLTRPEAGGGHRGRRVAFHEDDRRPLERHEPAELADERAERLVELERGAEGPGASVRRLEHVDAVTELVAQPFRLGRPRLGTAPLGVDGVAQATDDETGEHADEDARERRLPQQTRAEGVDHDRRPRHHSAADQPPQEPEAQRRGPRWGSGRGHATARRSGTRRWRRTRSRRQRRV